METLVINRLKRKEEKQAILCYAMLRCAVLCCASLLSHLGHQFLVLFLESSTDSFTVLQEFLGTLGQTRVFSIGEILRSEIVDTVVETSVDQRGVESHEVGHLLLLDDLLELLLFVVVKLIHGVSGCFLLSSACFFYPSLPLLLPFFFLSSILSFSTTLFFVESEKAKIVRTAILVHGCVRCSGK